jgi:peptidoglycan/xylan/chitin deacetylase (PgdA/CDA1 family)
MRRALLALLLLALPVAPAVAQRFVAIGLHDIADTREELTADAITTSTLVAFFDWLKAERWTPISLDDLEAARLGRRPLPPRAILLSFDDGYRSFHTRLFPLLLAYRYPAIIALVGSWMEGGPDATVRYGDQDVPRSRFITWAEAREMQASGLVEFASHSYALHTTVQANPQGNQTPSAFTWAYAPQSGRYEDDAALRRRVEADLRRAVAQHRRELGRAPRALVWPFGRYSGPALEAAQAAGFRFTLTLDPEPAEVQRPLTIGRFYPSQAPDLAALVANLRFQAESPPALRLVCLDPGVIAGAGDAAAQDAALGRAIEAVRLLGANIVALAEHAPGTEGRLGPAWYPTPMTAQGPDVLSRLVWQLRTRGGADAYVRLPLDRAIATVGAARAADLVAELVRRAPADGLLLEEAGGLAAAVPGVLEEPSPWATRARRASLAPATLDPQGQVALLAARRAEALRPGLRLMLASAAAPEPGLWPAPAADRVLLGLGSTDALAPLRAAGWIAPEARSRLVLDLPPGPRPLAAAQRAGATGLAYCADGAAALAEAGARAPGFSSASYPLRP